MRNIILAGVAAIALATVPAIAQDSAGDNDSTASASASAGATAAPSGLTADQQSTFNAWPADRQSAYTAWTPEYQSYFWTLTPEQQEGYWVLTPTQRSQIQAMTPEQRTIAWNSITRQLAGSTATVAANTGDEAPAPARTANQANAAATPGPTTVVATGAGTVVTTIPGNVSPPPAAKLNKSYPLCSRTVQDECQNRGEGGAPGHSRALPYWPGKPASEGGH